MKRKKGIYEKYLKRVIDVIGAGIGILVLSPLLAIVALLVRIKLGSPVIFKQERPGLYGKPFMLRKFRTMTDARDENGELLPDDIRLTKFGKWLRSTSLDELPELFNILNGDMSIVGCRPLLMEYLPYYTKREFHRHDVRPGLTGLAQVNGRNAISWEKRFEYDLYYVKHCSFRMDVMVLIKTVEKVLKKSDILVGSEIPAGRLEDEKKKKEE